MAFDLTPSQISSLNKSEVRDLEDPKFFQFLTTTQQAWLTDEQLVLESVYKKIEFLKGKWKAVEAKVAVMTTQPEEFLNALAEFTNEFNGITFSTKKRNGEGIAVGSDGIMMAVDYFY